MAGSGAGACGELGRGIMDGRLRVEDVVQTAHGGGAALEDIGDESQRDHGENELDHVRVEGHEFTQRDLPGHHLTAAEPEDQHERQADQCRKAGMNMLQALISFKLRVT